MSTNALEEHTLQLLRSRYVDTLPWLCAQTGAKVTIVPSGRGNTFTLVAVWASGRYEKYHGAELIRQLGRRGCARRLAELFIQEVRRARGEEIDDE
jgi:hypothetical protein